MIRLALRDWSRAPGPRRELEGKFSGEAYRKEVLLPALADGRGPIEIDLDGTAGLSTGFLEEAFGGLVRIDRVPASELTARLAFVSAEEPYLPDEILDAILTANRMEGRAR